MNMDNWLDDLDINPFLPHSGENILLWIDIDLTEEICQHLKMLASAVGDEEFVDLFYYPRIKDSIYVRFSPEYGWGHGRTINTLKFTTVDYYDTFIHINLSDILPKSLVESHEWVDHINQDSKPYVIVFDDDTSDELKDKVYRILVDDMGYEGLASFMYKNDEFLYTLGYLYLEKNKSLSHDDIITTFDSEDSYFDNYEKIHYKDFLDIFG
jgi:hypothetical protein